MKAFAILMLVIAQSRSFSASFPTWEELSSHLFTNCPIVWQTSADHLPRQFWVYQRNLPRVFPAKTITNAIVLASLQSKGFPQPTTNPTCIVAEPPCDCPSVCNFSIDPSEACMSFFSPSYKDRSPNGIPSDEVIVKRAWDCVPQLGLNSHQMIQGSFFTHNVDQSSDTNFICGRGVFLSRQLDGVSFFSADNATSEGEGFSIEFGGDGQIRFFSFRWSVLERYKSEQTASLQEINQLIKAHKTIVLPNGNEENYFARLKTLADAKKLTITKITPYYMDGVFGSIPTNYVACNFAIPCTELDAVADFGSSNATLRLFSPILSSDVKRMLGSK
jgi:hypothetical protein